MDHQRDILRLAFAFDENARLPWATILYSYVKKSGKNDGTGLNRWPVCPNRRSALCAAIRVGLRSADLTDSILRNVDAVKEALRKDAELIADGCPLPPTVIVPPFPQKESRRESRAVTIRFAPKGLEALFADDYGTGHKDKFQDDCPAIYG